MRRLGVLLLGLLVLCGCAKFPSVGSNDITKRLLFTMRVDGAIRTGFETGGSGLPYIYIIALRLSTDPSPIDDGPIPVITNGGNGFVAGNATHYILWNPLASPQYQIWRFEDDTLLSSVQTGVPINYQDVQVGDDTIQFEIDMSQLVPVADVDTIESIQVNFLTMNKLANGGSGREWDALGNSANPGDINRYFQFQPRNSITYTNANQGNVEPGGDVPDPDLDIIDWSIEVRLN